MSPRHPMQWWPGLVLAVVLHGPDLPLAGAAEKWENLFVGGKDLTGWRQVGGGKWSVEEGEIVGKTGDGRPGWLVWEKEYADFILELEARLADDGNSGVQFRSQLINGEEMHGYQADLDRDTQKNGLYDQGGKREWIKLPAGAAATAVKPTDWNSIRITAVGEHVKIEVNGVVTVDLSDEMQYTRGIIALQVHPRKEPPVHVRWRNIRINVLDENKGFAPLFNGRSLRGWEVLGPPIWRVVSGEIVGETSSKMKQSYLVRDKESANFHVKLKFNFASRGGNLWSGVKGTGNGGLFFRCSVDESAPYPLGPQVEIGANPAERTGLIYEPAPGRGWLNEGQWDKQKAAVYRAQQWNLLELRAIGPRILVHLNGYPVSDLLDDTIPRKGVLALQVAEIYGGQGRIRFKDIYYKGLPPPKPAVVRQ